MSISRDIDISVVMSVFNNADTLPSALESILSQEGVDFEFIVIDDGSTDGSGEILDEVATRDSRLKVVHKQNEGLTRALIEGCAVASAPWIARQDADDRSLPGRLRAQLDRALQPDAPVLVTCGAMWRTEDGVDLFPSLAPKEPDALKSRILEKGKQHMMQSEATALNFIMRRIWICSPVWQSSGRWRQCPMCCMSTPFRRTPFPHIPPPHKNSSAN